MSVILSAVRAGQKIALTGNLVSKVGGFLNGWRRSKGSRMNEKKNAG